MSALTGITSDLGMLFNGGAFGGGVMGQVAQSVAVGGVGSAVVASLAHPDVLSKLDPLGILGIIHPAGTVNAAAVTPTTPVSAVAGLNPSAKTMTISWYSANPTVAPLYLAQGWTIIPG